MQKTKFLSEDGYRLSIVGKNVQVTDGLRSHIVEKLGKVEHFTPHVLDINVSLDIQREAYIVMIGMKFSHYAINVHASTENMYSAIDLAIDKLFKLLRKYKSKLVDHRKKEFSAVNMKVNILESQEPEEKIINDEIESETLRQEEELFTIHRVVAKETMPLKTMTEDEATMKFEFSGDRFLIYRGEEDKKLKVIYRRDDEQLGVVEVES